MKHRPKRVVSIGYHEHDILLALGVRPVARQQWIAGFDSGVGTWADCSDEPRSRLLTELEFSVPKAVDDAVGDQIYRELSPERIDVVPYSVDRIAPLLDETLEK